MLVLRNPDSVSSVSDLAVRALAEQCFLDLSAEDEYDPDICGYVIVVEPFDSVEALESESGCPILRNVVGPARFGDPEFNPVFEVLEEHAGCYELVFVPSDGDFGVVIFIPKQEGIDPDLLALCATYAKPAP